MSQPALCLPCGRKTDSSLRQSEHTGLYLTGKEALESIGNFPKQVIEILGFIDGYIAQIC